MSHRKCEQIRIESVNFCSNAFSFTQLESKQEKNFFLYFFREQHTHTQKEKFTEHCINEPKGTQRHSHTQKKRCTMCVEMSNKKKRNLLVLIKNVSQVTKVFSYFFISNTKIYLIITHG